MTPLYSGRRSLRAVASSVLFFFTMSICPIGAIVLTAQAAGSEQLEAAQRLFSFAEYENALTEIEALLQGGALEGNELRDAHVLRGRCLLSLGREADALDAFCNAIKVDSIWQPDEFEFRTDEINAFSQAREDCELDEVKRDDGKKKDDGESGGSKLLYYIGGGVALLAGVAVFALGGGDDPPEEVAEELPGFPNPPED